MSLAEAFVKTGGVISDAEAHSLWESALDGPGVTQNEFATLEHIMSTFKFTEKARKYLSKLVTQAKSGKSMYKIINKVRYDRACLDLAEHLTKDGKLDVADAKLIWEDVEDGPGVTECEKRSVDYVLTKYTVTEGAKKYLDAQLSAWVAPKRKEATLRPKQRNRQQKKFTIQIDLVQLANQFKSTAGVISDAEAHKLWESALDGPGVTHNEFATLEYILSNYKFTDKARKYLEDLVLQKASGSSFYKMVKGVRYDRSCLDLADHLTKDGSLDLGDAKQLWGDVSDGGRRVTVIEKKTLEYIKTKHTLTEGAKTFLDQKLALQKPKVEKAAPKAETANAADDMPPAETSPSAESEVSESLPEGVTAAALDQWIETIWLCYDTDKSGELDKSEAKNFIQSLLVSAGNVDGFTDEAFDALFAVFDADSSGTLDKKEVRDFVSKFGLGTA